MSPPNYRYIQLEMSADSQLLWHDIKGSLMRSASANHNESFVGGVSKMLNVLRRINVETYSHPRLQQLRDSDNSFDLLVMGWFMNDYQVGLAAQFRCPVAIVSPLPSIGALRAFVGNPSHPSFEPTPMLSMPVDGTMTFYQRSINVALSYVEVLLMEVMNRWYYEPIYQQEFPSDRGHPTFAEAKKNVALVLVTQHFSQGPPTANLPALVEVSGLHIPRRPKQLPEVSHRMCSDFGCGRLGQYQIMTDT